MNNRILFATLVPGNLVHHYGYITMS